jgi:hypothetical protein
MLYHSRNVGLATDSNRFAAIVRNIWPEAEDSSRSCRRAALDNNS